MEYWIARYKYRRCYVVKLEVIKECPTTLAVVDSEKNGYRRRVARKETFQSESEANAAMLQIIEGRLAHAKADVELLTEQRKEFTV